jgi:hypothetical protein
VAYDRSTGTGRVLENRPIFSPHRAKSYTMNNKLNAKERLHIGKVKLLPCSVCDQHGPSDAHHIEQKLQYCVIALCRDCHNSWHGTKAIWRVKKMDELAALDVTIRRLTQEMHLEGDKSPF